MAGNSGEPGRTVTSKIAPILGAFTCGREHTLSDVAAQVDLPVSTVHRLLRDLVSSALLERTDSGAYRTGLALRGLAHDVTPPDLRERAPFAVDDLAAALKLPTRLGVLDELEVAYVEKRPGPLPVTSFPNPLRLPVHATAVGRALLAYAPRSLVQLVVLRGLARYTARTPTNADQLQRSLHVTRTKGFASADGELDPTVCTLAVPVFDHAGLPVAAVEVQVPRLTAEVVADVVPVVALTARSLRREVFALVRASRPHHTGRDLPAAL